MSRRGPDPGGSSFGAVAVGALTGADFALGSDAAGGGADAQLASKALASAQPFRTE
jgi:hypothetical protein